MGLKDNIIIRKEKERRALDDRAQDFDGVKVLHGKA